MDTSQVLSAVDLLIKLIQALVWPAVVVFLVVFFGRPLRILLAELREGSIKAGATGVEATFKRQVEAAAAIGLVEGQRHASAGDGQPGGNDASVPVEKFAAQIADAVSRAIAAQAGGRGKAARVLWVDDHPENNVHEMNALRALGLNVTISTSTEDALDRLRSDFRAYDVVISDMGRGLDTRAGYRLLEEMRKRRDETPFIVYAGSRIAEHQTEARKRGALGTTNRPSELIAMVTDAIQGRTAS